jgi:hypothetical protein
MEDIPERISGDPQRWLLGLLGSLTVVLAVLFTMIIMWTLRTSGGQWWRAGPGKPLGLEILEARGLFTQLAILGAGLMMLAEIVGLRTRLLDPLQRHRSGRGIVLRNIALVSMGGALVMLPAWNLLGAIPLGAIIGAEVAMRRPWHRSPRRAAASPGASMTRLRLGLQVIGPVVFLLALAVSRVESPESNTKWMSVVVIEVALMMTCVAITAWLVWAGLGQLGGRMAEELVGFVAGLRQAEFRHRAQWVHDHLLSEIRLLILGLESRPLAGQDVLEQLRDTDHRLRMAHLAEMIEAGPIRISSLIQPQIRRCLDHGVTLSSIPDFGHVDVAVSADTGRLISRVLSGLFSNAMNAGAARIGLEVQVNSAGVEIRVSDDAGGFDLGAVPIGRGLDQLIEDLGRQGVSREESPGGSIMRVMVPLSAVLAVTPSGGEFVADRGSRWRCG